MAAAGRNWLAPRKVFIVRWPSGVTKIRHCAVGGFAAAHGRIKGDAARADVMGKDLAELVIATWPMKAHFAPSCARPASVLAAAAEISRAGPMAA
jgi:hypothetical protein